MPGHAGSPYWAVVDFDSEGEDNHTPPSNRVYLDPWDNDAYGITQEEADSMPENYNSFVGEPVSASFYYVPTKNYDSDEDVPPVARRTMSPPMMSPPLEPPVPIDYVYGRKMSRALVPDMIHPDMAIYGDRPIHRRRSMYVEDPVYAHHPMIYEHLYGVLPHQPPPPRSRMSLPHHPEYAMAALGYARHRRQSRMTEAYEHFAYESLSPEYEEWPRALPKVVPTNFHLSKYGHLQIDYSCSWNSLDRLIRSQHNVYC